jgi:hypothetical protein
MDNAEDAVLLLRRADHTANTSHMIAKHCCVVTSLRMRGSVFTKPLPRSGLHNHVVSLLRACITETAVSVDQPFLHGTNTSQYKCQPSKNN